MRVLVCGGRDYDNWDKLRDMLDSIHEGKGIEVIIHGAAKGADSMADRWARMRGVPVEAHKANWLRYGLSAGPRRNADMLKLGRPTGVIAFPGGKGTADMVAKSKAAGVPVIEVLP